MEYSRVGTRLPKAPEEKVNWKRVIVVLEHCPLEQVQVGGTWELLSDKHKRTLGERNLDPANFRPDVVHQCLLHLLDSPLNRAGMLQVFLRTHKGVLISIDPRLRVPRSYRLFSKMFASLLFRLKIRAAQSTSRISLLQVVRNPLTDHVPTETRFIRVERDGELVEPFAYCAALAERSTKDMKVAHQGTNGVSDRAATKRHRPEAPVAEADGDDDDEEADLPDDPVWGSSGAVVGKGDGSERPDRVEEKDGFRPFAFIVGAVAKGDVKAGDYAPHADSIRLANRGMSAAAAVSLLCHAVEDAWIHKAQGY